MSEPSADAATDSAPASPFELRDQRLVAAPLVRRMVAFMYEGVLLFGVLFTLNLVYYGFTKQTNATQTHTPLLVLTFFVLGTYFIYFWIRGGQTLATRCHTALADKPVATARHIRLRIRRPGARI